MNTAILPQIKFTKIAHISDIHIRLFQRHREYRAVFDTLYRQLNEQNDNDDLLIVVTGDVVHSKSDMSPEMVSLTHEFFTNLTDIAPTIVIAGNHDLNVSNPHRMDALSPIISSMKPRNIYYFLNSGIYTIGNVDFAVHSIVGSQDEWPELPEESSEYLVAVYHGPIQGAATDTGYSIGDRSINILQFDQYPITLLGDIHKHQRITAPNTIAAYAGSLIQQNHGEHYAGHGWVLWDLETSSYKHIPVENDYGYATMYVKQGEEIETSELPKNVRLRLFLENFNLTDTKDIIKLIKSKINVEELSVNQLGSSITKINTSDMFDPYDVTAQNTWISEYIVSNYPEISQEDLDEILRINSELNLEIHTDELPKNIQWEPLTLKFDNVFSYGTDNIIDFSDLSGLCGLFSPNASGKTGAVDALCFALFDKSPRAFKGDHVMNTKTNNMMCEFKFAIDDETYIITRRGTRKKNGSVKVEVDFYKETSAGEVVSLNGSDRRSTNAAIRTYVGSYEDFILTTFSSQSENDVFMGLGQSDRKDLLSQFIGLTIFDRLYSLAHDKHKEIGSQLKMFDDIDASDIIPQTKSKLKELNTEKKTYEELTKKLKNNLKAINDKISGLYEKKVSDIDDEDVGVYITKLKSLITDEEKLTSELQQSEDLTLKNKKQLDDSQKEFDLKYSDVSSKIKQFSELDALHTKLEKELSHVISLIGSTQEKIDNLSSHEYDPECKYCMNNVFVKDALSAQKKQESLLEDKIKLKAELDKLTPEWESARKILEVGQDRDRHWSEIQKLQQEISKGEKFYYVTKNRLSEIQSEKLSTENQIKRLEKMQDDIKKNREIQEKIDDLKEEHDEISKELDSSLVTLGHCNTNIKMLDFKLENLSKESEKIKKLEGLYHLYKIYLSVVGRNGLPYGLIAQVMPSIQLEINELLSQMVNFTIDMQLDEKNININLVYDSSTQWPLELASGMERFISSLVIRTALTKISNLPASNFLIIDEGFGVLDQENMASLNTLLEMLQSKYKFVILISHLDIMRDSVGTLLEITKKDGFSKIVA